MCIFCKIINNTIPASIIYEDDVVIAILDIAQVTKGHTLVIPKKHFDNIYTVDDDTLAHMMIVTKRLAVELKTKLNAKGINILNNNEPLAGQSVEHLHFHIIPRYDENDRIVCEFKESNIDYQEVFTILTKK